MDCWARNFQFDHAIVWQDSFVEDCADANAGRNGTDYAIAPGALDNSTRQDFSLRE